MTLQPGRELDALVAEKVMGWPRLSQWTWSIPDGAVWKWRIHDPEMAEILLRDAPDAWRKAIASDMPNKGYEYLAVPHHSTDIAAAWQVVERILVLHPDVYPILEQFDIKDRREWNCVFWNGEDKSFSGHAPTPEHAICLAALEAVK